MRDEILAVDLDQNFFMGIDIVSDMGRWYTPVYYLKPKDLGTRAFETQIHKTRDGLSHLELSRPLNSLGYQYGGPLLQVAHNRSKNSSEEYPDFDLDKDLIIQATRPPDFNLDGYFDAEPRSRGAGIVKSKSAVERYIQSQLLTVFYGCFRNLVTLKGNSKHKKYSSVKFKTNQGGCVEKYSDNSKPINDNFALGYLAAFPKQKNGNFPHLIIAFSLGGTETLWFTHILSTENMWSKPLANDEISNHYESPISLFKAATKTTVPKLWLIEFEIPPVGFGISQSTYLCGKCQIHNAICWL